MLEAVILDFGHTIVDFALDQQALLAAYEEVRELLVGFGIDEAPSAVDLVVAVSQRLSAKIQDSYARQELEELDIVKEFHALFTELKLPIPRDLVRKIVALEHRALTAELFVSPANISTVRLLKRRGLKVGLVSNITFDGDSVRNDLDKLGLLDLFDAVILSSEIGVRKPHPRIYQVALDGLGVLGAQAVFVGDRLLEDVRGPQTAGMRAILTHEFRIEEPTAASSVPDAVIDRLSELPATLDLLPTSTQIQSSAPNSEESERQ